MKHPVVWFEVIGDSSDALQGFYGELFEWTLKKDDTPLQYGMIEPKEGERGIGGGVGQSANGFPKGTRFYVSTPDLEASVKRAVALGGKQIMPPTDLPDGPAIALIADPEGQVVGLVKEHA